MFLAVICTVFCVGFYLGRRTVPKVSVVFTSQPSEESVSTKTALININTASQEELALLPGIGESLAGRIIDYRVEHGNFAKVEDIMEVKGIGEKIFSELHDYITVGGKE